MPRRSLPFGPFAPDTVDYDNPALQDAKNVLPIFNSYRPVRKLQELSDQASATPPTGGIAHLITEDVTAVRSRPSGDEDAGTAEAYPDSTADIYPQVNEVEPDDSDGLSVRGDPSSEAMQLNMSSVLDPASNTDHVLRWRYRVVNSGGAWTLTLELMQGSPLASLSTAAVDTATGSADTDGFVERSLTLSSAQADAIAGSGSPTQYENLGVEFTATVPGSGAQAAAPDEDKDNSQSWKRGGTGATAANELTDIYEQIDEATADNADYVESQPIHPGGSSTVEFGLADLDDPFSSASHTITYRLRGNVAGVTVTLKLMEGETEISEHEAGELTTSFVEDSWTLTAAEAASIEDYTNLSVKAVGQFQSPPTAANQTIRPSGDAWNGHSWQDEGAATTNLYQSIDEATLSTSDYVQSPSSTTLESVIFDLDGGYRPIGTTSQSVTVVLAASVGSGNVLLRLQNGSGAKESVYSQTYAVTSTQQTITMSISSGRTRRITDWSSLELRIDKVASSSAFQVRVYQAYFTMGPARGIAYLSYLSMAAPGSAGADVSWIEFEVPSAVTDVPGDSVQVFCGTEAKIYQVASSGFTDVTRTSGSGDYGQGTTRPKTWSFASWGDAVVATNFADAVQIKNPSDSVFDDLITSSDKPRGKFLAVVGQQLVLANIDPDSVTPSSIGKPYTVWWSGVDDAATFEQGNLTTQSDYQLLRQTPGEITGLVGGEYGVIFKRSSIYLMHYIGPPLVYGLPVISIYQGTPYPRSIVPVGNDIYFWGNGGIFVVRSGQEITEVGKDSIRKYIFDSDMETNAIQQKTSSDERVNDSLVVGALDPHSGLIYWSYSKADDPDYQNSLILIYNPREDRFSYLEGDSAGDLEMALLLTRGNILTDEAFFTKGLFAFEWKDKSGTDTISYGKFSSNDTYAATLQTKILTSQVLTRELGTNALVRFARPMFRGTPRSTTDPNVSLRLRVSEDKLFQDDLASLTRDEDSTETKHGKWMSFNHHEGEFMDWTLTIPSLNAKTIKDVVGVDVDYSEQGKH